MAATKKEPSEWEEYPCSFGYYNYQQRFPKTNIQMPRKFAALGNVRVHKTTNAIQIYEKRDIEFYGPVADNIAHLQEFSESHDEAVMEDYTDYGSYGDPDRNKVRIMGWRAAQTKAEETLATEYIAAYKEASRKEREKIKEIANKKKLDDAEAARKLLRELGEL